MDQIKWISCFILILISLDLEGQVRKKVPLNRNNPNQRFNSFEGDTLSTDSLFKKTTSVELDTTIYDYYFLDNIDILRPYSDTLNDNFHQYNPVNYYGNEHLNTGNLGGSTIPIRYEPRKNIGLDYGFHQYDIYNKQLEDLRFMRVNRAFNDLYYSPIGGQANFLVKAKFHRNFANNTHFHIDYSRFHQEGFYSNQNTKTTNLALSLDWHPNKGNYRSFLSIITNNNNEEHNGGISDKTLFDNPIYNLRFTIPITLESAATRHQQQLLAWNNFYDIDSLIPGFEVRFKNQISYDRGAFKFADTDVSDLDSPLHSDFYKIFLVEKRGLRHFMSFRDFGTDLHLVLKRNKSFKLSNGLSYHRYWIDQEPITYTRNSLMYQGKLDMRLWDRFSLSANGELGLWDYAGDFKLNGLLNWKANKDFLALGVGASLYNYSPSIEQNRFFVNETSIWQNDFSNIFGSSIQGEISIPKFRLKASLKQMIENNSIYRDTMARPQQLEEILSVSQFDLSHHLKWSVLNIKNQFFVQAISDEKIIRPSYHSTHSLYIENQIFNENLDLQIGGEYTHFANYEGLAFSPVNGQFIPTESTIDYYPLLDFFINAKIETFRFFAKFENIGFYFNDPKIYYRIENHPQFDFKFRLGIRWQLSD